MSEQSSRKKVMVASPSCGLLSLPDEVVINCLARVSRLGQAALSVVSKSYRSVVVSPELYETRSRMGLSEECVYVFLDTPLDTNPRWFILRRGKEESFSNNRLIPIPSFPTPPAASFVPFGWGIYVIGGMIDAVHTSRVSFLDCRTHKWSHVPSMGVARAYAKAGVLDGKIYVMGGCEDKDPSNWAEFFDPKMQTWSRLFIPVPVMDQGISKVIRRDCWSFNFLTVQGMWNHLNTRDACVVDKLLYCCDIFGRITWCDPWSGVKKGRMEWNKVYGLDALQGSFHWKSRSISFGGEMADVWHCHMLKCGYTNGLQGLLPGFKLTKSGGNIVIFWDLLVEETLQIWCAEISLERRDGGQIWGTFQSSDVVLTIDPPLNCFQVLYSVNVNV
ncbi:unnamed protein product [Arabis nemorensis]|uniref:F-box domain-containing protein n=1 Tax=Arabis nemorensis TaxID=586526 RepID=A0A565C9R4_9BRAS|nr:unnamed protein product [Arabis nemorensis]